ncbi:MAG: choice-of-anchor Q domain-containing protein [Planctomycetota bacterium]
MFGSISRAFLQIFVLVLSFAGIGLAGQIIYVDADSPGGDGSSWEVAFRYLQDGLAVTGANGQIRVAQGTYVPDQNSVNPDGSGDRKATFQLISGVSIYGGYAGFGESDPNARDVDRHETILSGDLLGNDFEEAMPAEFGNERTRAENSYHVVAGIGVDETAVMDGFTITAGYADGRNEYRGGGGMYNAVGGATLSNCTFTRNWTDQIGGAVWYEDDGRAEFIHCRFIGNAAGGTGGAIANSSGSRKFVNCLFTGNVGNAEGAGAIYNRDEMALVNCSVIGNSSGLTGGISNYSGSISLDNCILWANSNGQSGNETAQIVASEHSNTTVNFCCIQGWTGDLGGTGNTGADPFLADADGADNVFGTEDDNPRLLPGSNCLEAGDNSAVPATLLSDLDGYPRITDGVVEIGAYEGTVSQAILLSTELLTVPEGGTGTFGVSLATDPQASVEVAVAFRSGDVDVAVVSGSILTFDSGDYSAPQLVTVAAPEDAGYLHGRALIGIESEGLRPVGVTVDEHDNEPTTGIVYVDDDSPGGDGMTWANAYSSLQDALRVAERNPQVWEVRVGQGVYRPNEVAGGVPGDREPSFVLMDGVTIQGGYAGLGAVDPNVRDVELYETILSGDLNGDDEGFANNEENSCRIVYSSNTNETAVLDGFTVTGGNVNGMRHNGVGIDNRGGSPTLLNCTFRGNRARSFGGGMFNINGTPVLVNCTFDNNWAEYGGAIHSHHFTPKFTNCAFTRNFAGTRGGAIDSVVLFNDLIMTNCTFAGNEAGERGGGVFQQDGSEAVFTNCILHDNSAYEGPQVALSNAKASFNYSCVQGGEGDVFLRNTSSVEWGPGNMILDPCFADALGSDYHLKSQAGRWEANEGRWTTDEVTSPCIDAGDSNSVWMAELWPHGKRVNMGAYGGTAEASMSESLRGNKADLNNDGSVDFVDFARLGDSFREEGALRVEDLNRDAVVDFFDILDFAEEWVREEP